MWVNSYACASHYRRYPVYSRTKRFNAYLINLGYEGLFKNYHDIMDIFGKIEFIWGMSQKTRLYFFNKSCVMFFIVWVLELKLDIKTLKDKKRVKRQCVAMAELLQLE